MENHIRQLQADLENDLNGAHTSDSIEALRVKYLGRKALINQLFAQIPTLVPEERGAWGRRLNEVKQRIAALLQERSQGFTVTEEKIDVTFPAHRPQKGTTHILGAVTEEICTIFKELGFAVVEGGEVEDEWHNFCALNIPLDHPSRDAFDTFYLDVPAHKKGGKYLLRSHTSPSQIRVMKERTPPLAVISPGRVYRPDQVDASHSFMFHQIEGFAVDTTITFAHLKGVLLHFARRLFSSGVQLRFRPHFFPFTEPSAEVDVSCIMCQGNETGHGKCSVCKGKGWLEILGCGMIHPNVLEMCGIDSRKYQGFAFGMGADRIAMLRYQINDIRLFYDNDIKFLEQFSF